MRDPQLKQNKLGENANEVDFVVDVGCLLFANFPWSASFGSNPVV
jgi:hypothetical protein